MDLERQPIDQHDQHGQKKAPRINKYFEATIRADASDLHLKAACPPHLRLSGRLAPTTSPPLSGELNDVINASVGEGMKDFNMSLMELIELEMIDPRAAYSVFPNADELRMRMKGIDTKRSGLLGR